MHASAHVTVHVDLRRVRRNIVEIRRHVGRAEIHAVVKADAYGVGARAAASAVQDLVDGFVVFQAGEATGAGLAEIGKPVLALGPSAAAPGLRRAVWDAESARAVRAEGNEPVLSVDTGMQRFSCPPAEVEAALAAGQCREAFTHGTRPEHVRQLLELVGGRGLRLHAAGTRLLGEPQAHLDLVRPGLALYRGAVAVRTRLVETRDSRGPAGYTGFTAPRHGVVLAGYSNGLRPGPCLVGDRRRRVIEVGMQSAFVALEPGDRISDEVTLLGNPSGAPDPVVTEDDVAAAWGCTPHEALVHLSSLGQRVYA
jgi:alanine racemase